MSISLAEFLKAGTQPDFDSERGVSCAGQLPEPSDPNLVARAKVAKATLGKRVMILGHHYQRDEVIQFADITGDSFKLAQAAADNRDAEFIIFCGVHFMAESADILTSAEQRVILPDLAAGCSMADMATLNQVREAWQVFEDLGITSSTIPVTYMNSSAAIKSFTGEHAGTVCTSSNAERAMRWALEQGDRIFFLPDQHLGRNTAVRQLGFNLDDCVLWNPWKPRGGLSDDAIRAAKVILWRGHCSVHGRFSMQNVEDRRSEIPGVSILVHPECPHDVVMSADHVGSTEMIISTVKSAPVGSKWAIGTELNLVGRLAAENPDKEVHFLDKTICYCSTMNRIDLPHLVWALESLAAGQVVNVISVDATTSKYSRLALERMLALAQTTHTD
jgi:quinolinate synthase